MGDRTDEELLAAIARGPGALPEFYRRHIGKITGIGARRFANPDDVVDFVADVFVEVMRSGLPRLRPGRHSESPRWPHGYGCRRAGPTPR